MKPLRSLLQALRQDRGDADPISVMAGSALFLIASIGIAGLITMSLASASRAQGNTEITQAVQTQISTWKATPYLDMGEQTAASNAGKNEGRGVKITAGDRTVYVQQQVVKNAGTGAYRITVSAPRQVLLTTPLAKNHCLSALTAPKENCLTLSATVSPTPFDVVPKTPAGATINVHAAGRGLVLADLNIAKLTTSGALDVRVSLKPRDGLTIPDKLWQLALTCDDMNSLALTPDSAFKKAASGSTWMSARVTIKGANNIGTCAKPALRVWIDQVAQPAVADIAEIKIWRVSGGN